MVKLFVNDQDDALAEDSELGDYRWPLVRLPDNQEFALNLDFARTDEQRALVGRQAAERTRAGFRQALTSSPSSKPPDTSTPTSRR
jgi:hypothetical protein